MVEVGPIEEGSKLMALFYFNGTIAPAPQYNIPLHHSDRPGILLRKTGFILPTALHRFSTD